MAAPINPGCPAGGTWYACDAADPPSQFIGCCRVDACQSNDACPGPELAPASFDPASEGTFADQNCTQYAAAGGRPPARFYTCALTSPPFMGCCRSDPCAHGGCPAADLVQAVLAEDRGAAWGFLGRLGNGTVEAVSISEVVPSPVPGLAASASTSALATPSPAAAAAVAAASGGGGGQSVGVAIPVIGTIVGVIVVFLVGISVVYCLRRRRARRAKRRAGGPASRGPSSIERRSEPAMAPLAAAEVAEACANDKFSVSGPTTRDSQASTVAPRHHRTGKPFL
jgi:hypothetical protein